MCDLVSSSVHPLQATAPTECCVERRFCWRLDEGMCIEDSFMIQTVVLLFFLSVQCPTARLFREVSRGCVSLRCVIAHYSTAVFVCTRYGLYFIIVLISRSHVSSSGVQGVSVARAVAVIARALDKYGSPTFQGQLGISLIQQSGVQVNQKQR